MKTTWGAFKGICMEKWSDTWLPKILKAGKLENIQGAYPYRLMEVHLEHVSDEKDLGIMLMCPSV